MTDEELGSRVRRSRQQIYALYESHIHVSFTRARTDRFCAEQVVSRGQTRRNREGGIAPVKEEAVRGPLAVGGGVSVLEDLEPFQTCKKR